MGTVMTSSPGRTPAARRARCKAEVPELTATQWSAPVYAAKASSNSATRWPRMKAASAATSSIAGRTSSRTARNWALRSMNGTAMRAAGAAVSTAVSANFSIATPDRAPRPQEPGRTPGHHGPRFDVFRHHRPRSDQGAGPDRYPTQDHRPAADRGPFAHAGRDHRPVGLGLRLAIGRGPRVEVVDEHDAVADEYLVLDRHALADERVARDLAPGADRGVLLNLHERPDPRVVADPAAVQVDKAVDGDVSPEFHIRRDANAVHRVGALVGPSRCVSLGHVSVGVSGESARTGQSE